VVLRSLLELGHLRSDAASLLLSICDVKQRGEAELCQADLSTWKRRRIGSRQSRARCPRRLLADRRWGAVGSTSRPYPASARRLAPGCGESPSNTKSRGWPAAWEDPRFSASGQGLATEVLDEDDFGVRGFDELPDYGVSKASVVRAGRWRKWRKW